MIRVPHDFEPLLDNLQKTCRRPATARRILFFFAAAILTVGDRTVSNVLTLVSKFTPDANKAVIEMYGGRWNIETTFQEMREHLGLETTRGWSRQTVLPMAPCLFCLYSLVVLFLDAVPWLCPHVRMKQWV